MKGQLIIISPDKRSFSGQIDVSGSILQRIDLSGEDNGFRFEARSDHPRHLQCLMRIEGSPDVIINFVLPRIEKPGVEYKTSGQQLGTGKYTAWTCTFAKKA